MSSSDAPAVAHGAPSLTSKQRRLSLAAVIASTAGLGLSYGISFPLTTLTFEQWGASSTMAGLAGAAPPLAVLLMLPLAPRIAARVGVVPAMVLGCLITGLGFLAMPLLPSEGAWLVIRFLMGAGLTLPWLIGETWINVVTDDSTRGRVIGIYTATLFTGFAVGPLLLERIGVDGWAPFIIGAAAMGLAGAPLVLGARLAPKLPREGGASLRTAARYAPFAMVGAFVGGMVELGYFSLLPLYAIDLGVSEADSLRLLSALMVGGIVMLFGVGWLADRLPRQALMAAVATVFAALSVASAFLLPRGAAGFAVVFVLGGVMLGIYLIALTLLGERTPVEHLAMANAAFLMLYQIGGIAGPALGGVAMDLWRPHGFVALMVLAAGACVAAVAWARVSRSRAGGDTDLSRGTGARR